MTDNLLMADFAYALCIETLQARLWKSDLLISSCCIEQQRCLQRGLLIEHGSTGGLSCDSSNCSIVAQHQSQDVWQVNMQTCLRSHSHIAVGLQYAAFCDSLDLMTFVQNRTQEVDHCCARVMNVPEHLQQHLPYLACMPEQHGECQAKKAKAWFCSVLLLVNDRLFKTSRKLAVHIYQSYCNAK